MSYLDRVKGVIKLTSPDGDKFTGKWAGNNKTTVKKLGLFSSPGVDGTTVQDNGTESPTWPLTIYFDGEDHDKEALKFDKSLYQRGPWTVEHPTKGNIQIQPVSWQEGIQPVTNGGYTVFETEWITPLVDGVLVSSAQLANAVEDGGFLSNITAAAQFVAKTVQDTIAQTRSISVAVSKVITSARTTLRAAENFELIPAEFEALVRGIQATTEETPIDTTLLAAQVQSLIQLFAPAQNSSTDGLNTYQNFSDSVAEESPQLPTIEGKNAVAVQELALAAASAAVGITMLVGGERTRGEAIENSQGILSYFRDITDILDVTQELYRDNDFDLQYFSQSESYNTALETATVAARYKLESAFDLAIEKKIVITEAVTPIQVAIENYEPYTDENYEEFLSVNDLVGKLDMFLLEPGLEVVVFV